METQRHGWRAIIYDAPWARFVPGQVGVIISEDGRSCETSNDDKSSIKIEADPNIGFSGRANGHVLFTQKGSNLYDIVCLEQESGGTYEIEAEPLTVDGCEFDSQGYSYNSLINDIVIKERYNKGNWRKITDFYRKSNMISNITQNNFNPKKGETMTIDLKGDYGATASTTLTITSGATDISAYTGCDISGKCIYCEPGKVNCKITKKSYEIKPESYVTCKGGKVNFYLNTINDTDMTFNCEGGYVLFTASSTTQNSEYKIVFTVTDKYVIKNCGIVKRTTAEEGVITSCKVKDPIDDVIIIGSIEDNAITVSVSYGITNATFSVINDKGDTKEVDVEFKCD